MKFDDIREGLYKSQIILEVIHLLLNMFDSIDLFVQIDEVIDIWFLHVVMFPKLEVCYIHFYDLFLLIVIDSFHLIYELLCLEE